MAVCRRVWYDRARAGLVRLPLPLHRCVAAPRTVLRVSRLALLSNLVAYFFLTHLAKKFFVSAATAAFVLMRAFVALAQLWKFKAWL